MFLSFMEGTSRFSNPPQLAMWLFSVWTQWHVKGIPYRITCCFHCCCYNSFLCIIYLIDSHIYLIFPHHCLNHCRTLTTPVKLIKCLKSIKEFAFVKSSYPVIITLEDHLTPDLQAKVAEVCLSFFLFFLLHWYLNSRCFFYVTSNHFACRCSLKHLEKCCIILREIA